MQIISDLEGASQISDPEIRDLVCRRIHALSDQGFALMDVGHFLVVQATDRQDTIERHLGVPISSYEMVEQFPSCFDAVYVLEQSGTGIELFIPKDDRIDKNLRTIFGNFAFVSEDENPP